MLVYKNEESIVITMDEAKQILRTQLMKELKDNDMESNEACTTIEKGDVGLGNNPQHKPKTQCLVALEKLKRKKPSFYLFKKALLLQKIRDIMREDPEIARWKDIKTKLAEFFFPMWWDLPKDHELKLEINNVIENEFRKRHEESETPAGETKRRGGRKKKRKTRKRKRKSKKKKSKKKTRKKRKTKRKKGGSTKESKKTSKEEGKKQENKTPDSVPETPMPTEEQTQEKTPSPQPLAELNVAAEQDIAAAQELNLNELYQELFDVLSPSHPDLSVEDIRNMMDDFLNDADLESIIANDFINYIKKQSIQRREP